MNHISEFHTPTPSNAVLKVSHSVNALITILNQNKCRFFNSLGGGILKKKKPTKLTSFLYTILHNKAISVNNTSAVLSTLLTSHKQMQISINQNTITLMSNTATVSSKTSGLNNQSSSKTTHNYSLPFKLSIILIHFCIYYFS